jgi:hypothetical protein
MPFLLQTTGAFQTAIILEEAMSKERTVVNNLIGASELAALADNPGATLDVTEFDLGRLPERVKAALYTKAATFDAPQLQTSGDINAPSATSFNAPQLQTSGDIIAPRATSFSAPQLQIAGDIIASATSFSAPQLQMSGNIYARPQRHKLQRPAASDLGTHRRSRSTCAATPATNDTP